MLGRIAKNLVFFVLATLALVYAPSRAHAELSDQSVEVEYAFWLEGCIGNDCSTTQITPITWSMYFPGDGTVVLYYVEDNIAKTQSYKLNTRYSNSYYAYLEGRNSVTIQAPALVAGEDLELKIRINRNGCKISKTTRKITTFEDFEIYEPVFCSLSLGNIFE